VEAAVEEELAAGFSDRRHSMPSTRNAAKPGSKADTKSNPYRAYEELPIWRVVSDSVAEPLKNGDLCETTAHAHIVGYICMNIVNAKKLKARS
jgi:hypothetical protein